MLSPLPDDAWNYRTAAHLLSRAGFGGAPSAVEKFLRLGVAGAVAWLVDYEKIEDSTSPPDWAKPDPERVARFQEYQTTRRKLGNAPEAEKQAIETRMQEMRREEQRSARQRLTELRGWWLERMANGPRPLQEKLTLFWHGHFATSAQKVKEPYLMWLQNETFRRHASGPFLAMLRAVTRDPAMLIWLDQAQSRKEHPNENYAREVMELFALGEGAYTEKDITEAARAFTGLTYNRLRQEGDYRPALHDGGIKTFLGKTGAVGWEDVLERIVAQPQAARFLSRKIWIFFAGDDPSDALVEELAKVFAHSGCSVDALLRVMFRSAEFYSPEVMGRQVKSPVQWLVGSVRVLERELPPAPVAANILQSLGQELFAPPNVKGWDGGISWITTSNLLERYNRAATLIYGQNQLQLNSARGVARQIEQRFNRANSRSTPVNAARLVPADSRADKETVIATIEKRFLQAELKPKQRKVLVAYLNSQAELDDRDILETIRLLMSTPEYQLT